MMDREQLRLKQEQFKREMTRVSEEKSRKLFDKDEDRSAWEEVIRKSVEKEIEKRVREALGTPPKERQRKRMEEMTAKRLAQINEEKRVMAYNIRRQASFQHRSQEEEELLWLKRQKHLQKFNRRRTMREIPSPILRAISEKRNSSTSHSTEQAAQVVWKSCERIPEKISTSSAQFKRAVSTTDRSETASNGPTRHVGPFFPSGRMPCMDCPKHLTSVPRFIEDLNNPGRMKAWVFTRIKSPSMY